MNLHSVGGPAHEINTNVTVKIDKYVHYIKDVARILAQYCVCKFVMTPQMDAKSFIVDLICFCNWLVYTWKVFMI